MVRRRAVLQGAFALAAGSALTGTAGSSAATAEQECLAPYDAGEVAAVETTIAGRLVPTAVDAVPLPPGLAGPLSTLRERFDALSLADLGPVRGSLALDGDRVVGGGVRADADFDPVELQADLDSASFRAVDTTADRDYFRTADGPFAVGFDANSVAVGYGADAIAHATAAAGDHSPTTRTRRLGRIAEAIDGDSRAVARLGSSTRTAAGDRLADGPEWLSTVLDATERVGVGVTVGEDRARLTYGLDLDPSSLDPSAAWELVTAGTDRSPVQRESIAWTQETLVVRAVVPTARLTSAHAALVGAQTRTPTTSTPTASK
jgi:hypothetical protein